MTKFPLLLLATLCIASPTFADEITPPPEFQFLRKSEVAGLCHHQMVRSAIRVNNSPSTKKKTEARHHLMVLAYYWAYESASLSEEDVIRMQTLSDSFNASALTRHMTFCFSTGVEGFFQLPEDFQRKIAAQATKSSAKIFGAK